jgi:hypothetical protein
MNDFNANKSWWLVRRLFSPVSLAYSINVALDNILLM